MKHLLKAAFADVIPDRVLNRRDKMGFPVPLKEWFGGELRGMTLDIFTNLRDRHRPYINAEAVLANFDKAAPFSRQTWGLLSLRSEEHPSELQSLMRISYAVFCL